ncbi:Cyclic di-GMP phosphodiesterase response regulator RpfG [Hartmannibacter diazotrophicus]|uniref:Cyclic di-GMP phosphodiesterase response regulator RpfG n=2 Tax=Hartmannibacter diazotrophicus TaxID=1482074 RepID=A0A2C9D160_9HYPH|nr:HD domain-containing phosphohydrolase [Hartmannibacter diazotrophicus]SON53974.1 Cyclic di-GMP phosphodiesterase response regulator RpfG [Hartmannibacter diazotrophicus]
MSAFVSQGTAGGGQPLRVLVVDDSKAALAATLSVLGELPGMTIESCVSPIDAYALCSRTPCDIVLLDYAMPELDGIGLTRRLRELPGHETVPIVMITSSTSSDIRLEAIKAGVNDFLNKPFDPVELQARVSNFASLRRAQLELASHALHLEQAVELATAEIVAREEEIIWRLARAIETRDGGTGQHVSRVASIASLLAAGLGYDEAHCRMIYLATPLHDVGKIGISDKVLCKPGRLTPEEMAHMRQHVEIGVRLLEDGTSELLRIAAAIAGGHHERWDGTGYPAGLKGQDIPLVARIVAVADVFDALCSERPYKAAWSLPKAYAEIIACSGTQFDPDCVAVFRQRWPEIVAIMHGKEAADDRSEPSVVEGGWVHGARTLRIVGERRQTGRWSPAFMDQGERN